MTNRVNGLLQNEKAIANRLVPGEEIDGPQFCNRRLSIVDVKQVLERSEKVGKTNRALRHKRIEKYARLMASGRWVMNGECIVMDERGVLINGRHRLEAFLRAAADEGRAQRAAPGLTLDVSVCVVPRRITAVDSTVYDDGAGRSPSDHLRWLGWKHETLCASALRMLWVIHNGMSPVSASSVIRPDSATWIRFARECEDAVSLQSLATLCLREARGKGMMTASVLMLVAIGCGLQDVKPEMVDGVPALPSDSIAARFLEGYARRAGPYRSTSDRPSGHPSRLISEQILIAQKQARKIPDDEKLWRLIRAWNLISEGSMDVSSQAVSPKRCAQKPIVSGLEDDDGNPCWCLPWRVSAKPDWKI